MNTLKNIKTFLNKEHKGSQAVEAVILTPLMLSTFFILLFFFFMALTFISYNNVANSIAQELNMRQSGYLAAVAEYPSANELEPIQTYIVPMDDITGRNNGVIPKSALLNHHEYVNITPYTQELEGAVMFALNKYRKQFLIPFAELARVQVRTSRPIKATDAKKMAGTLIEVKVLYKVTLFRGGGSLRLLTAVGYSTIN